MILLGGGQLVNWIQNLSRAIHYIENNLTNDIGIDEVSSQAYTSSSHFQLVFHVVMGMTVGEYIRNRRMILLHKICCNQRAK
jgi:AraC-like DNA-binding protein